MLLLLLVVLFLLPRSSLVCPLLSSSPANHWQTRKTARGPKKRWLVSLDLQAGGAVHCQKGMLQWNHSTSTTTTTTTSTASGSLCALLEDCRGERERERERERGGGREKKQTQARATARAKSL